MVEKVSQDNQMTAVVHMLESSVCVQYLLVRR
jgi:hypothetical protein